MATESKRMSAGRETREVREAREATTASRAVRSASSRASSAPTTPRTAPTKSAPTRTAPRAHSSSPSRRGAVVSLHGVEVSASASERETPPRPSRSPRSEPAKVSHTPARDMAPPPPTRHATNAAQRQFAELREALETGWEIVQPVFARPLWSAADDSLTAFSFVLRQGTATRLITVPSSRIVERFIATQRLSVDERR